MKHQHSCPSSFEVSSCRTQTLYLPKCICFKLHQNKDQPWPEKTLIKMWWFQFKIFCFFYPSGISTATLSWCWCDTCKQPSTAKLLFKVGVKYSAFLSHLQLPLNMIAFLQFLSSYRLSFLTLHTTIKSESVYSKRTVKTKWVIINEPNKPLHLSWLDQLSSHDQYQTLGGPRNFFYWVKT